MTPYFTGHPCADAAIMHQGQAVERVMHQGVEIYPRSGPRWTGLPPVKYRTVEDGGRKYFEFGFVSQDLLAGNPATGWTDPMGFVNLFVQWSDNLANWAVGKFLEAPVPVVAVGDAYEYWVRAINPIDAISKTGTALIASNNGNGDSRNNPFTGITIAGAAVALPNFPYTMPGDASQMQTDLRAAGYAGATVVSTSGVDWSITLPDLVFDIYGIETWVSWPAYTVMDIIFNVEISVARRYATAALVDDEGNKIERAAYARLAIQPGPRFGFTGIQYPSNPVFLPSKWELPDPNPPVYEPPVFNAVPTIYWPDVPTVEVAGSPAPGSVLTRPSIVWSHSPTSVIGTWWKNGAATEEHGANYSDTVDGDLVQYREIAVNEHGSSEGIYAFPDFAVSLPAAAFISEVGPAMTALVNGKSGAADMNVFSALDHAAGTYTRNVNSWAWPLVSQLTGVAAWKSNGHVESYGGVLITPRHVLYCRHAHPHAEGTWIYPSPAQIVRFVLPDGTVVDAVQLAQSMQPSFGWTDAQVAAAEVSKPGFVSLRGQTSNWGETLGDGALDLCVAVLDRDVQALGAHVMPVASARTRAEWWAMRKIGTPLFASSQGYGRATNSSPPPPISEYPQQHRAMQYVRQMGMTAEAPYDSVDYQVWDGDSGTPTFLLHRGSVYLDRILTTSPWGGVPVAGVLDQVQQLLAAADAGAIALGRLTLPTGLTVSAVTLPAD